MAAETEGEGTPGRKPLTVVLVHVLRIGVLPVTQMKPFRGAHRDLQILVLLHRTAEIARVSHNIKIHRIGKLTSGTVNRFRASNCEI